MKSIIYVASAFVVGLASGVSPATAGTILITPSNAASENWFFYNDATDTFQGNLITSAQTPPGSSVGSVDMSLPDNTGSDKPLVFTTDYAGVALSSLTSLSYQTFVDAGTTAAPFFQLGVGTSVTDTSFEGRLSFVPTASIGGTLTTGTWQTWDALDAQGGWFFTKPSAFGNDECSLGNDAAIGSSACSLASIIARNPGISINDSSLLGLLGVRSNANIGEQEQSFTDTITVGVGVAPATTFDFTTATPEPSTIVLFSSALAGLGLYARRRRVAGKS